MNQIKFTNKVSLSTKHVISANCSKCTIKSRLFLLMLLSSFCFSALHAQNLPARPPRIPTPNDDLVSFEVNDDKSATLRLYAPNAKAVELGGDLKAVKIDHADNGVWTMVTAPHYDPSAYRYYFLVDGMKVNDPKNPMVADFRPTQNNPTVRLV